MTLIDPRLRYASHALPEPTFRTQTWIEYGPGAEGVHVNLFEALQGCPIDQLDVRAAGARWSTRHRERGSGWRQRPLYVPVLGVQRVQLVDWAALERLEQVHVDTISARALLDAGLGPECGLWQRMGRVSQPGVNQCHALAARG
jgi:hypothetical protein